MNNIDNYTLIQIKRMLNKGNYRFSAHAESQIELDGLNIDDVVESIINATSWYKKESDKKETKYTFISPTYDNIWIYSVGKIISENNKEQYYFYLTAKKAD